MATCRGCGKPVIWLPNSKTAKKAPVDPDPVEGGNVVIEGKGDARVYRVLTKKELAQGGSLFEPDPDRHTLHFATCSEAAHFRSCRTCHKTPCVCASDA